jgi:histidinol-phosphate/aromatic aminotransferase/cobyric acid decarboxylase-like protein
MTSHGMPLLDFSSLKYATVDSDSVIYSGRNLNLYQRLIQYFSVVAKVGGRYLDLINCLDDFYPQVFSMSQAESIFIPEHGYGSPDGSSEISCLLREYEQARTRSFQLRSYNGVTTASVDAHKLATGIGAGTTGVVNCLVPAIRDYCANRTRNQRRAVVIPLPLYSVYDGIVSAHGLEPIYIRTRREAGFLPEPHEIKRALQSRPLALILTYPGNPAQTTYSGARLSDLQQIIRLCQEQEIFLIVDNVYQDTIWEGSDHNPELFGLCSNPQWLLKVCGPSKDRPACSGWRIGYYIGDPRLRELFFYYSSIQYNTPNSSSRCMLALDVLARLLRLQTVN